VTFHLFAQKSPWTDFYQTWNQRSTRRHNQLWQILWQSIKGFKFYRRSKFEMLS